MKKVLILGAGVHSLGIIRSFGILKDYSITVLYSNKNDFAQTSKYVSKKTYYKNLDKDKKKCIDILLKEAKNNKENKALIIPTNDQFLEIISKNHTLLSKHYTLFTPPYEITSIFLEKEKTYKICEKLNIPHPKTFYPKKLTDINKVINKITFPVILKPTLSHLMVQKFNTKLLVCKDQKELIKNFRICMQNNIEVMISEYIPGNDSCMYTHTSIYSKNKKPITQIMHNTIRQTPPNYGVSRVAKSMKVDKNVEKYSKKLLDHTAFYGMAGIQYKKDPRDNIYKLIEVNCRTIRPIILYTYSNLNTLKILYESFVENKTKFNLKPYKTGVYYIELYSELFNYLFRKRQEKFTTKQYLKPYRAKYRVYGVYNSCDIKPFLKMLLNLPMKYVRIIKNKN